VVSHKVRVVRMERYCPFETLGRSTGRLRRDLPIESRGRGERLPGTRVFPPAIH